MKWRGPLLLGAALALIGGVLFGLQQQQIAAHADDDLRPDWSLPDASGSLRQASEFDGRWQLVNFWASWCPPCLQEIPLLVELQTRVSPDTLQVLGPALDRIEAAQAAAERHGINYPILLGDMGVSAWMDALGDTRGALPYSVLINPQGQILKRHWGALSAEQVREWERLVRG